MNGENVSGWLYKENDIHVLVAFKGGTCSYTVSMTDVTIIQQSVKM